MTYPVQRTEKEWRERLTPEEYEVMREHGTEQAFCGLYHNNHQKGMYYCKGCDTLLFASDTKFDSGTGWPSFFQPLDEKNIEYLDDRSFGMLRTEVNCAICGSHLGHVFHDGPPPTGLRYCINSVALTFQPVEALKSKQD